MKRLFKILGILILLLLAALIILPMVFKSEIIARTNDEINKHVNAEVSIGDISLDLFSNFPNFSLTIEDLTIDGIDRFEGVRLVDIADFQLELDLFSVISGEQFQIEDIKLENTSIHLIVEEDGAANYDIAKTTDSTDDTPETKSNESSEPASFVLKLKSYSITDFNFHYDDRQGNVKAVIKDLDHNGKGDFSQDIVDLKTNTSIAMLTVENGGVAYLNKVSLKSDFDVEVNQPESKLSFGENGIALNDLIINFAGFVAFPNEGEIDMDLTFAAPDNQFRSVLSLIPAVYYHDFKDVKTSGNFDLKGLAKGKLNAAAEQYPVFEVKLGIDNGSFRYPDLPAGVEKISVDAHVYNQNTNLDGIVVDISEVRAAVAENPISASLKLQTPISDPSFDAYLNTELDLENIAKVVPVEGLDYKGHISSDLSLAGKMSDIDNENYEAVKAEGNLLVKGISLANDSLPYDIAVPVADLSFSPQLVKLNDLQVKMGHSDISANGQIDNLLSYVLRSDTLKAAFNVNSNLLDINQLAGGASEPTASDAQATEAAATTADTAAAMTVIRIPTNIDFALQTQLASVIYDDLNITDVKGGMKLKDGAIAMEGVSMNMLGGALKMSGAYNSAPVKPEVNMDFAIENFDFQESYNSFKAIQELAPVMANTTGKFSTGFSFNSLLNEDMTPDLPSVLAKGNLRSRDLITSPNSLQELADLIQTPSLATIDIGKIDLNFEIKDGRLHVEPFEFKTGNISSTVQGSNGLDQSLDYVMDMKIPASEVGDANLLGDLGAAQAGMIDLKVNIGGTMTDPKITTSFEDLLGGVINNIKEQIDQEVEEAVSEIVDDVNKQLEELVAEAEKLGNDLVAKAEADAADLRASAKVEADKVRKQANEEADKLEKEAEGNFLKEAAAKEGARILREEGEKTAKEIEATAAQTGDALIQSAKDQKQKLIDEAKEKGKVNNP